MELLGLILQLVMAKPGHSPSQLAPNGWQLLLEEGLRSENPLKLAERGLAARGRLAPEAALRGGFSFTRRLYMNQKRIMANTMQLLTGDRDTQRCAT
jgi:hypothetical protein